MNAGPGRRAPGEAAPAEAPRAPPEVPAQVVALEADLAEHFATHGRDVGERAHVDALLRGFDVAIVAAALVLLAPLLLLVAVALLLSSGRPLLYRGLRVGRHGHVFTMLKFRTLAPDAEVRLAATYGPDLTRLTELEVTSIGRVLRAAQLDELPQLWNVLKGDMSIVGPRPIRPAFFAELVSDIPQYWQRLVVRPGLTGFAQMRMTREETWQEKLAHDLEYIADRSVGLFARVIAATSWRVLVQTARALGGVVLSLGRGRPRSPRPGS